MLHVSTVKVLIRESNNLILFAAIVENLPLDEHPDYVIQFTDEIRRFSQKYKFLLHYTTLLFIRPLP